MYYSIQTSEPRTMSLQFHNAFTINKKKPTKMMMTLSFKNYYSRFSIPYPTPPASSANPNAHISSPSKKLSSTPLSLKHTFLSFNSNSSSSDSYSSHVEAYTSILELCAAQKAIAEGQQLHAHILKSRPLLEDAFLSTKLLFAYGKCGHLSDAHKLFNEMPHRTIFTWNALIGAYASTFQPHKAIELYLHMWDLGVMPDACTLASVLKACGLCGDLCCGSEIHGLAVKFGLTSTTFVVNALVSMYSKCGSFARASMLFETVTDRGDIVTWNSIISACLQDGEFLEALNLFREMVKSGIGMNSYTVVGVLQACAELFLVRLGMEVHASLLKFIRGFEIFESNALVVMYSKCGRMGEALGVFSEMGERDNVSWNSILSGFLQNGLYDEAEKFFRELIALGFEPDQVSVISVASALGHLGNLYNGKEIHGYAIRRGLNCELQVGNTLMDMYTKCCNVDYAVNVFYKMPFKDYISWTTVIAGYAQSSRYLEAFESFREVQRLGMKADPMMIGSILLACSGFRFLDLLEQIHGYTMRHGLLDLVLKNTIIDIYGECGKVGYASQIFETIDNKDVVSWTSMINCYVRNGLLNEALSLSINMIKANVELDAVALVSILSAAAGLSSLRKGKEVHGFIIRRYLALDNLLCNSLVDMYAQCGNIASSFRIFNRTRSRDLVLWTTMIDSCGMHGQGKEAIELFSRMEDAGVVPDHVAFLALLYACSHSGLNFEGKFYLEKMISEYTLEPWPEHYACVVDLLGRSGRINEAFEFIEGMPIKPVPAVWCSLLGACRVHSNHQLAIVAANKLLELEPENPGNYILISNTFAAVGKWKEVEEVRRRMEEGRYKKEPACSWIELGNEVHTFVARDNSHKDSEEIYMKLAEITQRLETKGGYVADTRYVLHDVREEEKVKMLNGHSERLAIAFGLINTADKTQIRIIKNLRVCGDCHEFTKLVSKLFDREIVVRDANRFHHFRDGYCSCRDFW